MTRSRSLPRSSPTEEGMTFSEDDLAFIRHWAGGHPGLLEATCRVLGILTGRPGVNPRRI